jgi:hypothetical protein
LERERQEREAERNRLDIGRREERETGDPWLKTNRLKSIGATVSTSIIYLNSKFKLLAGNEVLKIATKDYTNRRHNETPLQLLQQSTPICLYPSTHAAVARDHGIAWYAWGRLNESRRFCYSADGKNIVAPPSIYWRFALLFFGCSQQASCNQ